jgi:hypothetical protein
MSVDRTLVLLLAVFTVTSFIVTMAPLYYTKRPQYDLIQPLPSSSSYGSSSTSIKHLAILCIERSGSTWLTAMLNNNPHVHLLAEPLLPLAGQYKHSPLQNISAINEFNFLITTLNSLEQQHLSFPLQSQSLQQQSKKSKKKDDSSSVSVSSISSTSTLSSQLIGFNEKFLKSKYFLPSHPTQLHRLSLYLKEHNYKILLLIRKNFIFQTISTIHAIQLSEKCGNAGWSKVNQIGWNELCGQADQDIHQRNISVNTLKEVLKEVREKTRQLQQVLLISFFFVFISPFDHFYL